ncbi:hypothetical protein LFL96_33380 [Paraburkholderia sp. D15]|uniref:hypothetical protein n=1 Tax=Paraburkholderia sp. D15 TaxID=2880218 RepID=UPI00247983D9|nr:hypothetical protein [Paraburkholderia sp. D15]WGS53065.1 hypothetical protein LFL96_33380 [Paraburkholderia sp. D15]
MKTLINKPIDGVAWRRLPDAPRALFAAPPPDLLTLVIADQQKRKAQAEIRRDAYREALYDIPAAPRRHEDRGTDDDSFDADDE